MSLYKPQKLGSNVEEFVDEIRNKEKAETVQLDQTKLAKNKTVYL